MLLLSFGRVYIALFMMCRKYAEGLTADSRLLRCNSLAA